MSLEYKEFLPQGSQWTATRGAAQALLSEFLPSIPAYAKERNYDRGDSSTVSRLSPYIRRRLLTEREIVETVCANYRYGDVAKFVEEVCWRTYWKGWMEQHPAAWSAYKRQKDSDLATLSFRQYQTYQKAIQGDTGIECFDHWIKTLVQTGYLHNHARMWTASIWIFTLNLPWALGADLFLRHLIDGDPASNTLSWRWVAGLFTPGKAYLAKAENIRRYTGGRFFPEGQLASEVTSLSEIDPIPEQLMRSVEADEHAHLPSLSLSPAGLLILPDDMSPESSCLSESPFNAIAAFESGEIQQSFKFSNQVRDFERAAMEDTMRRAAAHWNLKPSYEQTNDLTVSICAWARRERLKAVRILQPPVGPWRDKLPGIKSSLARHGVRLMEHRREWDHVHWPHARRGFFQFRKGLQERLEALGLVTAR
jgi:deoxyribodipyrimidine photo-lyase